MAAASFNQSTLVVLTVCSVMLTIVAITSIGIGIVMPSEWTLDVVGDSQVGHVQTDPMRVAQ